MVAAAPVHERQNYFNRSYDLQSWLLTVDHKRIAILYAVTILASLILGSAFAVLIRIELLAPRGAFADNQTYNSLFSMHGAIMVYFFLIPAIPATLGNFFLPIMVGARNLAFPRVNLLSWYLFALGGCFAILAMSAGGLDTGWTLYPYSTSYSNSSVLPGVIAVIAALTSAMLTGLNFVVTVHRSRASGMTWLRMPLFAWAAYSAGAVQLVAGPVSAGALALLFCSRAFRLQLFAPAQGGDAILFQRLFWFYGHAAAYLMLLPAIGIISELLSTYSRKPISGYRFVALSSLAIAVVGILEFGQVLFSSGELFRSNVELSFLSYFVVVPLAITVLNWISTLHRGSISLTAPMLYACGFIVVLTVGGLSGLFTATLAINRYLGDSYFLVAQLHYFVAGGTLMAWLGGIHYWWPKVTGRMYAEPWAKLAAGVILLGVNLSFLPEFVLGYLGAPNRHHVYPDEFQALHWASAFGGIVLGMGWFMTAAGLLWSLRNGSTAGPNPWGASGLEWKTSSPPPTFNFDVDPIVTQDAYD